MNYPELEALLAAATPGPWVTQRGANVMASDGYSAFSVQSNFFDSEQRNVANASLAVAAVNALPDLLAKSRAYDALVARVEAAAEVTVGENQYDYLIFVDTRAVELLVQPLIGKRVRLLAVEE